MLNVVVCGDLSARRPGEATRNHPLPAARLRRGAFLNFILHRERYSAIFAHIVVPVMRTVGAHTVTAGSVLAGGTLNHDTKSVRIPFSGLGRALQPRKQSRSGLTQALQINHSSNASASELHSSKGSGSYPTHFGSHPTQTGGHPTQNRVSV